MYIYIYTYMYIYIGPLVCDQHRDFLEGGSVGHVLLPHEYKYIYVHKYILVRMYKCVYICICVYEYINVYIGPIVSD